MGRDRRPMGYASAYVLKREGLHLGQGHAAQL